MNTLNSFFPFPFTTTIKVTASTDFRDRFFLNATSIEFAGSDYARATFSSKQFGQGLISDNVSITGDSFRNFISVHLTNGDTEFSAAGWSFTNWVPYNPFQSDQVTIYGTAASDRITGSSQADGLIGNDGNDLLVGLDGEDYLIGGNGNDTLIGGTGDDHYRLDNIHAVELVVAPAFRFHFPDTKFLNFAFDQVVEGAQGGTDIVELYRVDGFDRYVLPGNVENGVIFGTIENGNLISSVMGKFTLIGNGLANVLTGNDDTNLLQGLDGTDQLKGKGGNDTLIGGAGADVLDGGTGIDTASYAGASAGVIAILLKPAGNTGGAAGDTYVSIENLAGSSFNDNLNGNNSVNEIAGGAGNDAIRGYRGNDVLWGQDGGDAFIFNTAPNAATNVDRIMDFSVAGDTIWLENAVFTALGAPGVLSAAAFKSNATGLAGDASDRIIHENDTGKLFYDADGTGAIAGVQFATLTAGLALTAADFLIV